MHLLLTLLISERSSVLSHEHRLRVLVSPSWTLLMKCCSSYILIALLYYYNDFLFILLIKNSSIAIFFIKLTCSFSDLLVIRPEKSFIIGHKLITIWAIQNLVLMGNITSLNQKNILLNFLKRSYSPDNYLVEIIMLFIFFFWIRILKSNLSDSDKKINDLVNKNG